ncbi:MAG: lycopene cyclase domain-containing protein [Paludibacter sp.]|nr:lycopene cyclase domain-containing protein [Paludibacter sp.]
MNSLYSILLLSSIAVPLALSFDKKLRFYKQWKYLFPSIIVVAILYIAVDVWFTKIGVWGFNNRYYSQNTLFGLPVEEWLFFMAIPYASIFLHDSIVLYFNKFRIKQKSANVLSVFLLVLSVLLLLFNFDKAYTVYMLTTTIAVLILSFFDSSETTSRFYLTFLIILLPFIAVNAILTGSFIAEPVVWYNNGENLGIRFLTIPIEDFGYAFSLILFILLFRNKLKTWFDKSL